MTLGLPIELNNFILNSEWMPQVNVNLNENLDKQFRDTVYKQKGLRRGAMLEAFNEAINLWIKQKNTVSPKPETPAYIFIVDVQNFGEIEFSVKDDNILCETCQKEDCKHALVAWTQPTIRRMIEKRGAWIPTDNKTINEKKKMLKEIMKISKME